MHEFTEDAALDATLVAAAMHGGFPAFCAAAMAAGIQGGPDVAVARAEWFKKRPVAYRDFVVARVEADEIRRATERAADLSAAEGGVLHYGSLPDGVRPGPAADAPAAAGAPADIARLVSLGFLEAGDRPLGAYRTTGAGLAALSARGAATGAPADE